MNNIIPAIFNMVINLAMMLLFIRFFVQFADIKRYDPFAAPFYKTTGIVDVFSSIFPDMAKGRFCTAAMALLFLVYLVDLWGNASLAGQSYHPIKLFVGASLGFVLKILSACQWLIIAMVIVSWIIMLTQNMSPLFAMIMQMADPIIAPFKRISPDLGMIDISPMFAILGLWIAEEVVKAMTTYLLGML